MDPLLPHYEDREVFEGLERVNRLSEYDWNGWMGRRST